MYYDQLAPPPVLIFLANVKQFEKEHVEKKPCNWHKYWGYNRQPANEVIHFLPTPEDKEGGSRKRKQVLFEWTWIIVKTTSLPPTSFCLLYLLSSELLAVNKLGNEIIFQQLLQEFLPHLFTFLYLLGCNTSEYFRLQWYYLMSFNCSSVVFTWKILKQIIGKGFVKFWNLTFNKACMQCRFFVMNLWRLHYSGTDSTSPFGLDLHFLCIPF